MYRYIKVGYSLTHHTDYSLIGIRIRVHFKRDIVTTFFLQILMSVAMVAGATGAIGGWLVRELAESPHVGRVYALVRRPNSTPRNEKITEIVLTGDNAHDFKNLPNDCDVVFSCVGTCDGPSLCVPLAWFTHSFIHLLFPNLGTTIKKAGSKEAFRAADFTFNTELAAAVRELGVPQFYIVSSLGADADSSVFYLQVKGEVEAFVSCDIRARSVSHVSCKGAYGGNVRRSLNVASLFSPHRSKISRFPAPCACVPVCSARQIDPNCT